MYPRPATTLNHGIGNVIMNKGIRKIPYKSDMNPEKILLERLNIYDIFVESLEQVGERN